MIYEYNLINNLSKTANSYSPTFYIIGAMMLIGGIAGLITVINSESGSDFFKILTPIIIILGGFCFLIVAYIGNNAQKSTVKYSIQISDEKIMIRHGKDSKVKKMLTSEISKVDFNNKDIHIFGKGSSKIIVDLELISPKKKKNELKMALKKILKKE